MRKILDKTPGKCRRSLARCSSHETESIVCGSHDGASRLSLDPDLWFSRTPIYVGKRTSAILRRHSRKTPAISRPRIGGSLKGHLARGVSDDEANLSAQYAPPEAQAWFSRQDEDTGGQNNSEEPARQGSRPTVGLTSLAMRSPRSLTATSEFRGVFGDGRRAHRDGLTVWALSNPSRDEPYLGLAVGTGTGGAVVRNRVRRRLRAVVRGLRLGGVDLVVKADRRAAQLSFQELEEHLRVALTQAGVTFGDT